MSFIVSGRRTYGDLVAKILLPEDLVRHDMKFYFYDFNAKLNYTINEKNRLFISGYFGKDVFELGGDIGTSWGNTTGTIRWNHLFSERIFSKTSLIYSKFDYGFISGLFGLRIRSGIEDLNFKEDVTLYSNPSFTLKSGMNIIYHVFRPGEISANDSLNFKIALREKRGFEGALYIQGEHKIGSRLNANYGLRFSVFSQVGPGWFYQYNAENKPVDSSWYNAGKAAYPFFSLEPRATLNYMLNEKSSFKLSYNRMAQYIHLLSGTTSGSPTDVWMPSSNNLKPVLVDQFSSGLFRNFLNNSIETSIKVYYKNITNTIDYEDGAEIIFAEHVESQILSGKGRSYGLELYIKKKYSDFTGWISYTLSKTENKIEGINNFSWYPVKYDKTHDFSITLSYKMGKRLVTSSIWTFATGNATTFPSGKYLVDNNQVPFYTERNGYRMPPYHRLDLNLALYGRNYKKYKSEWTFSVYNVYNRHNAYIISFRESKTTPGSTEAVKLSLFGIVPSITYNFRF
ncbi:MAG: TonB-dependent receptor [Bacteroidales bacterium]|nr:TonB-dependent receptor [Bacteroidales bacterium]